jgi:predicted glutamine amidotransferase
MCRLFGLTTGGPRIGAWFWLLDAPDSLLAQSRRNADGSGIGYFDERGGAVLDKQPEPAFAGPEFAHDAKTAVSDSFVAHVRIGTAGGRTLANTHPFAMAGRIMAHNGGFGEIPRLEAELGSYRELVRGETDSERYFALITQQTQARGGDVGAGFIAAARWIAANLPVVSLNAVVAAPGELWALRYPGQHALHVIDRPAGTSSPVRADGAGGDQPAPGPGPGLHVRSSISSVHSAALDAVDSVVVASERLDGESGWRMLAPGELIHVGHGLATESVIAIPEPPARLVPLTGPNPNVDT